MTGSSSMEKIPLKNPNIVIREEFDDWALLFDPDTGRVFGINPTGVMVWKHMDGTSSLEKISLYIAHTFDKDHTEIIKDISDFLDRLIQNNFISFKEG